MSLTWWCNLFQLFKAIIVTFKDLMLNLQMTPKNIYISHTPRTDLITKVEFNVKCNILLKALKANK